ncbi:MAG TPA: hypothetical protein VGP82_15150 [Ktedonobacterales bacterium]|jgi:hypothetical protein|nr:hypothetical protein [Ktedonobacterales bacterium]
MELPQPEDLTLTWGDLCCALAEGKLPSRKTKDCYVVRQIDVRRLHRRTTARVHRLDRWLDGVQSDAGIFA